MAERIKRHITLSQSDIDYLQALADKQGVSLSVAISMAIERLKRLESKQS